MHAIMVISRLLGHADPETTVGVYIHTIDVLCKRFITRNDSTKAFSLSRAADIMGVSKLTAKTVTAESEDVTLLTVLAYCLKSHRLPTLEL